MSCKHTILFILKVIDSVANVEGVVSTSSPDQRVSLIDEVVSERPLSSSFKSDSVGNGGTLYFSDGLTTARKVAVDFEGGGTVLSLRPAS